MIGFPKYNKMCRSLIRQKKNSTQHGGTLEKHVLNFEIFFVFGTCKKIKWTESV